VVFALFSGTRGLFAGWLRGVVLTALTPLFVVLGGSLVMELLVPVVAALRSAEGGVDGRAALALFMIAAVHVALMAMVLKVCGSIVSAWQVFGLAPASGEATGRHADGPATLVAPVAQQLAAGQVHNRTGGLAAAQVPAGSEPAPAPSPSNTRHSSRMVVTQVPDVPSLRPGASPVRQRARGIGSRFRAAGPIRREIVR
jgi:type IV secretion system protein VirB6